MGWTLNPLVVGSNPTRPTNTKAPCARASGALSFCFGTRAVTSPSWVRRRTIFLSSSLTMPSRSSPVTKASTALGVGLLPQQHDDVAHERDTRQGSVLRMRAQVVEDLASGSAAEPVAGDDDALTGTVTLRAHCRAHSAGSCAACASQALIRCSRPGFEASDFLSLTSSQTSSPSRITSALLCTSGMAAIRVDARRSAGQVLRSRCP